MVLPYISANEPEGKEHPTFYLCHLPHQFQTYPEFVKDKKRKLVRGLRLETKKESTGKVEHVWGNSRGFRCQPPIRSLPLEGKMPHPYFYATS